MKNYKWRYDTQLFTTKKEVLEKIGKKENWANVQNYFAAKNSITKEYFNK